MILTSCRGSTVPPPDRTEVTVAVVGFFSTKQPLARAAINGARLAADGHRRAAGTTLVAKVVGIDTGGTPRGAAAAARRVLKLDRVAGVIGPLSQGELSAAGPVFARRRLAFLTSGVTTRERGQGGWGGFRRLVAADASEGAALARAAVALGGSRPVAVLHQPGSQRASDVAHGAREQLKRLDVRLPAAGEVHRNQAAVSVIRKRRPSVIIFAGDADRGGLLIASLRRSGFKGAFLGSAEIRGAAFARRAGASAAGAVSDCVCAPPSSSRLASLASEYRRRFRGGMPAHTAEAFDGTLMILEAAEEIGTQPGGVAAFLDDALRFRGAAKEYIYREDGELHAPQVWLYRYRGGWKPL